MAIRTDPKIQTRAIAAVIDYSLYFVFFIWAVTTFGEPNEEGGYSLTGPKGLMTELMWFIYFPVIESISGQTLGKKILGLKVVTKSGSEISFWQAFKRHLVDLLDFGSLGLVAYLAIKNTPDHQRLGDLWAKTIVIGGDKYNCSNCKEPLSLSPDEIIKREFVCPVCSSVSKIQ